jgi:hypothetical protein
MLVKATQHVKDRLERQIHKLADSECKAEFGKPARELLSDMPLGAEATTIIDQLYWGEHLPYRDKLPKDWFNTLSAGSSVLVRSQNSEINQCAYWNSHRIGRTYTYGENRFEILNSAVTAEAPAFLVKVPKDTLVPPDVHAYNAEVTVTDWNLHPALRDARDKAVGIIKIVDKWRGIHAKILELFDSTKSVNEAVKLWPELASFLNPEDRSRLEKQGSTKKDRESRIDKAKEVLASLDTQSIVADVVGIKLAAA